MKHNLSMVDLIGSGAFGNVALALDTNGKKVVLKQIALGKAVNKASYHREVYIMENIPSHPNIPKLLHAEVMDPYGYLMQEYVGGLTINILSYLFGKTNIPFLMKISKTLIQTLNHLHENNIYHLDLNEGNMIICEDPFDPELPLTMKLIDFGISCKTDSEYDCTKKGMTNAVTFFQWPYKHKINKDFDKSSLAFATDDLWQAASLIYHIAFGSFENFNPNVLEQMKLFYFGIKIPKQGGYPVPPKKGHNKNIASPQDYEEVMEEIMDDQKHVANLYKTHVIEGPPIFLFDPYKDSIVHDLLRLMMPRTLEDIFTGPELIHYIEAEWFEILKYGYLGQRHKINPSEYPCEDPMNSFYKENCDKCNHCQWTDTPVQIKSHFTRCVPRNLLRQDEIAKTECLAEGKVWNPYRKSCEVISDESTKILSNRYSILFRDGLETPISGAEIKRRIKEKDYSLLNPDEVVIEKLREFSYHPLHTIQSHSFFFNYYNTRITEDYSDLEKLDLTKFREHVTLLGNAKKN